MDEESAFKTAALTEVNLHILDAARDSISQEQEWEFFCECGRPDCHEHVELTIDTYVALHDSGGAVLADGHWLSQIERARRLGEESEALRHQAEHQVKRAKKNIRAGALVVDDYEPFRRVAGDVVSHSAELRVVGVASSGDEALRLLPDLNPDLVLLDIHMPGLSGIETARLMRRVSPRTAIVLVSAEPAGFEEAADSVGATALIDKAKLRPEMLDALWREHSAQQGGKA